MHGFPFPILYECETANSALNVSVEYDLAKLGSLFVFIYLFMFTLKYTMSLFVIIWLKISFYMTSGDLFLAATGMQISLAVM